MSDKKCLVCMPKKNSNIKWKEGVWRHDDYTSNIYRLFLLLFLICCLTIIDCHRMSKVHTVYRQKVLVTFKKSLFFMQKSYRLIENFNFKCLLCEFSFVCVSYAEKMLMFYLYDYRYYRSLVRHVWIWW